MMEQMKESTLCRKDYDDYANRTFQSYIDEIGNISSENRKVPEAEVVEQGSYILSRSRTNRKYEKKKVQWRQLTTTKAKSRSGRRSHVGYRSLSKRNDEQQEDPLHQPVNAKAKSRYRHRSHVRYKNLMFKNVLYMIVLICSHIITASAMRLDVEQVKTNNINHKLICTTVDRPIFCGAEFFINETTLDDMHSVNGTCYHKDGLCDINICDCDCNHYTLYLNLPENETSLIFGCEITYEHFTNKTRVSMLYNKTGLYSLSNGNQPTLIESFVPKAKNSDGKTTERYPDNQTDVLVTTVVISSLILLVTLILMIYRLFTSCRSSSIQSQNHNIQQGRYKTASQREDTAVP